MKGIRYQTREMGQKKGGNPYFFFTDAVPFLGVCLVYLPPSPACTKKERKLLFFYPLSSVHFPLPDSLSSICIYAFSACFVHNNMNVTNVGVWSDSVDASFLWFIRMERQNVP